MSLQDNIKNGLLTGGGILGFSSRNQPAEYKDRAHPYFSDATRAFVEERAQYASDFFTAKTVGLDPNDPLREISVQLRMANVVRPSAAIQRAFDDFKEVLLANPEYDYIRQGAKFFVEGSWWLAYNPDNISSVSASGIIRRCNATWNFLDYYGNLHREPICVEATHANANAPDSQQAVVVPSGYFNVVCQYNEYTAQINDNTRLILGSRVYSVSGFSDFETEFTEDDSSVRLLRFSVRVGEPNHDIDDMARRVAGGKTFSWALDVSGATQLYVGGAAKLAVASRRNGETVESTREHPIDYRFESCDRDIVTVDRDGNLKAVAAGATEILVSLAQNPEVKTVFRVTVSEAQEPFVAFDAVPPASMDAYGVPVSLRAAYFENGVETDAAVQWAFTGANNAAYSAEVAGNTVILRCWAGSVTPLTVTAMCNGRSASAEIALLGL